MHYSSVSSAAVWQVVLEGSRAPGQAVPSIDELMEALALKGVQSIDQRGQQQLDCQWNVDSAPPDACEPLL